MKFSTLTINIKYKEKIEVKNGNMKEICAKWKRIGYCLHEAILLHNGKELKYSKTSQ